MKKIIIQLLSLSLLLLSTACEDNRMNYMVDDQIYLLNPGFNETDIFNWGDFTYNLYVIKGGKGRQGASVEFQVNETLLTEYNAANGKNYKLLPAEYYTIINKQISFGAEDYRKSFQIKFDTEAISQLQTTSADTYVLPCQMSILNATIETADPTRMNSMISPVVKEPYLQLQDIGLLSTACMLAPEGIDEQLIYSRVQTNYYNDWDLSYTLEIDPSLIEAYNRDHGTTYKLLPEATYEFDKSTWNIPAKRDDQYIKINIKKKGVILSEDEYLFGDYIIPIRLATVSKFGINKDRSTLLYPVTFHPNEMDRAGFTISDCSSESPGEGFGKEKAIDNDMGTYWKNELGSTLPDTITMDMQRERILMGVELSRPKDNTDTRKVSFEISTDSLNYQPLTNFDFTGINESTRKIEMNDPKKARFLRCIVTESNNGSVASIAEIKVKGLRK